MSKYMVVTNNPMVYEELKDTCDVMYDEVSYEDILKTVRDRIHEGHLLLTHPLSGSVKPNETPYKSILISKRKEGVDSESLRLIENAIDACHKFEDKKDRYSAEVYQDFQLIDWTLIKSGIASADAW